MKIAKNMFCALVLCVAIVAMMVGAHILGSKLAGYSPSLGALTFGAVVAFIFLRCYHIAQQDETTHAARLIEQARRVINSDPDFESLAILPQDQRPHTDDERLEVLKVKRDEILKDMRDILDSNHVTDPVHLRGAALNDYINDNFEVKYIRDTIQFLYDKIYPKK